MFPISKESLRDYDDLMDIINNDLLIDLDDVTNEKYWNGSSSTGIKGIVNTDGHPDLYDRIWRRLL